MNVIAGIDAARARWNVLEHPFYVRWEKGELTRDELADYAGEYRHAVVALARAARTAGLHADEEAAHVSLWDDFGSGLGADRSEPRPQTRCCADAWSAAKDELGAAAILYAIESGQPEISATKLRGLVDHYGFDGGSPGTAYFELHAERDHEHAAEARSRLDRLEDAGLVERTRDPSDRRRSHVKVTRKGARALARGDVIADRVVAITLSGLDESERAELARLLEKGVGARPREAQSTP